MAFQNFTWHKHPKYICSTNPTYLQPAAINAAFASADLYWTSPFPFPILETLLSNSLCLGLYDTSPSGPSAIATSDQPDISAQLITSDPSTWHQIGFRRLITDGLTFAYLTDYYVLESERGKGLGAFLMQCTKALLDEIEKGMDRGVRGFRVLTLTREENVERWEKGLGVKRVVQGRGGVYVERSGIREGEGAEEDCVQGGKRDVQRE